MRVGVMLPGTGPLAGADALRRVAELAETVGFSSVWASDHVAIPLHSASRYLYAADGRMPFAPDQRWIDPFLALTWAAAATTRIRLGTSVLVLPLRPTLLVAKTAASLDDLSGGRLRLGVGSGWLAEEFALLGQSFEDRGRRMTQAIADLRACWSAASVTLGADVDGRMPFAMEPKPPQRDALPILVGGSSDAALRRAAAVGDGWHPSNLDPVALAARLERLRELVREQGRSFTDLLVVPRPGRHRPLTRALAGDYAALGVHELVADIDYRRGPLRDALEDLRALGSDLQPFMER